MVKIRMSRVGRKNLPLYRVVVVDSREQRDGRYLEHLGNYDPSVADPAKKLSLDVERYRFWIGRGARPSEAFARLCGHTKVLEQVAAEPAKAAEPRKKKKKAKKRKPAAKKAAPPAKKPAAKK